MKKRFRSWTDEELAKACSESFSYRMVIMKLGLVPAGGNYLHIRAEIEKQKLSTVHFTGKGWNTGPRKITVKKAITLSEILREGSKYQTYKLKRRLISAGLKMAECELCGWCRKSVDGRIPIELDHINGDHEDNRLENLRILCPNCHSLQATHRGLNKKSRYRFRK